MSESSSQPPPRPNRTSPPQNTLAEDGNLDQAENVTSSSTKRVSFAQKESTVESVDINFWTDHEEWKRRVLTEKLFENPKVFEPETTNRSLVSLNPTVYYKIKVDDFDGFVKRRYSDFEWLQELLQSRFVGMVIPPLPPKVVGSGNHFIHCRMRGLVLFLQKIAQNAYLKSDQSVYSFFTEVNSDQWETIKAQSVAFEAGKENVGHERWLQALSRYELPSDSKNVIMELTRCVETLNRQLGKLTAFAVTLSGSVAQFGTGVKEFDQHFQDLLISEMISTNLENQDDSLEIDQAEVQGIGIRNLGLATKFWGLHIDDFSRTVDNYLVEALRFEHGLVVRLSELLKRRAEVIKLHDKAVQKKILHEREKKLAEHSQILDQLSKLQRKIVEDNERVRNTYDHALFLTKGLFFSGIRHFTKVKNGRLNKLRELFAEEFVKYHLRMMNGWKDHAVSDNISKSSSSELGNEEGLQ